MTREQLRAKFLFDTGKSVTVSESSSYYGKKYSDQYVEHLENLILNDPRRSVEEIEELYMKLPGIALQSTDVERYVIDGKHEALHWVLKKSNE